ncbi:MAG: Tetratricopeptide 2 repeat protein [Myxococcales bacterium]|nr:Tetratricopeptide 2 repeat protein [Myxococcales bacterium]
MGRLVLAIVLLLSASTTAQPKPEGTRLFEEGRELAKAGKYAEACERFEWSLAIDRAPGTTLNYGDCLEKLGQLRKAFMMYDEASREFDRASDARAGFARERASAVLGRLGTILVKIADPAIPGLVVELASQSVPPRREMTERFEPEEIVVTARAPGRQPFRASALVVAGTTVIVEVPVLEGLDVAPAVQAPRVVRVMGGGRSRGRVRLAFGLGVGGGVALIASSIIGIRAKQDYDAVATGPDCSRTGGPLVCSPDAASKIESAGSSADLATGVAVAGGLLVGTAVIVYVTAPREALTVTPTASASTVGMAISGRF